MTIEPSAAEIERVAAALQTTVRGFTTWEDAARAAILAMDRRAEVVDEDDIADAIWDSIDMDWTARDGARAVMRLLHRAEVVDTKSYEGAALALELAASNWDELGEKRRGLHGRHLLDFAKAAGLREAAQVLRSIASPPPPAVAVPEGQFLLNRLDELEIGEDLPRDFVRDWLGHVEPAIARFRKALAAAPTPPAGEAIEPNSEKEWALELRACGGANDQMLPKYARRLIADLWAEVVAREPAADAPVQEPVAVKPLEWAEKTRVPEKEWGPPILEQRHGHHSLGRYAGSYSIQQIEPGGPWGWWNTWTSDCEPEGVEFSEEAAIAVCNADFAARIRSALVSAPPTYADAEAKGRLPTRMEAAHAASVLLRCNGADLSEWGGDDLLGEGALGALKDLATIRSLASPAPKGET